MASAKPYRREPERQDARRAVTGEYRKRYDDDCPLCKNEQSESAGADMDSLLEHPPHEVWIVSTPTGPDHVALTRQCAMEHAAIMAGDFPELGPWRVCKYIAEPFASKEAFLGNATTGEMLDELKVRADIHGYSSYRTVDPCTTPLETTEG